MLKRERHALIIKQINLHNKVLSADLSVQLNVSEDTIRRDLNELAKNGKVLKVHGGALSRSFHVSFNSNEVYCVEYKREIARKAIQLITDGMMILTGGGTTMNEFARLMPESVKATFFTISPLVALELAERNKNVILIGGQISKDSQISVGFQTISTLSEISFDLCFLGTNSISVAQGITDSDWDVVQIKKAMIRSSRKLAIMTISEKLNSAQPIQICAAQDITYLITELGANDEKLSEYHSAMQLC